MITCTTWGCFLYVQGPGKDPRLSRSDSHDVELEIRFPFEFGIYRRVGVGVSGWGEKGDLGEGGGGGGESDPTLLGSTPIFLVFTFSKKMC